MLKRKKLYFEPLQNPFIKKSQSRNYHKVLVRYVHWVKGQRGKESRVFIDDRVLQLLLSKR